MPRPIVIPNEPAKTDIVTTHSVSYQNIKGEPKTTEMMNPTRIVFRVLIFFWMMPPKMTDRFLAIASMMLLRYLEPLSLLTKKEIM